MKLYCSKIHLMIYLLFYSLAFYSTSVDGGNMQNVLVDMAVSIVERGSFDIGDLRANSPDVSYYNGKFYSGMAPGTSLLAVPVYGAARGLWHIFPAKIHRLVEAKRDSLYGKSPFSIYNTPHYKEQLLTHGLMTLLFAYLTGVLAFYLLCRLAEVMTGDERAAKVIGLTFALGSIMIFYTTSYYTQSIALFFLLLGMFLIFIREERALFSFLGGVSLSFAGTTDYPYYIYAGLIVLAAIIYFFWNGRRYGRAIATCLGFGLVLGLIMLFHYHLFDSPFKTPAQFRYEVREESKDFFKTFPLPTWTRTRDMLWSSGEGLLWYCPVALLFPFGIAHFCRRLYGRAGGIAGTTDKKRAVLLWLMAAIIALSIFHFTRVPWSGAGAAYGPRYLLSALPFMILLAYPYWKFLRVPFYVLAAWSILFNHLGMIRVPLGWMASERLRTGAWPGVMIRFSPVIRRYFSPLTGITLDVIYQVLILIIIFYVPFLIRRRAIAEVEIKD